jgi:type I site-specific restriction endonuclease
MSNDEILKKIKDIIFSVPGEIYKYEQPEYCFDEEWEEASDKEKAFMLLEDLLINLNREQMKKEQAIKNESLIVIKLEKSPRFYSVSDENMFFNAIYSVPAINDVKGSSKELYLSCSRAMTSEENKFLIGLFNRYQIPIPAEIK